VVPRQIGASEGPTAPGFGSVFLGRARLAAAVEELLVMPGVVVDRVNLTGALLAAMDHESYVGHGWGVIGGEAHGLNQAQRDAALGETLRFRWGIESSAHRHGPHSPHRVSETRVRATGVSQPGFFRSRLVDSEPDQHGGTFKWDRMRGVTTKRFV
jgi:hypothetical protein